MAVFGLLRRVVWQKFTDVSEALVASIIRAMSKPRADGFKLTFICKDLVSKYNAAALHHLGAREAPAQPRPPLNSSLAYLGAKTLKLRHSNC
jgi:hypothetical protein